MEIAFYISKESAFRFVVVDFYHRRLFAPDFCSALGDRNSRANFMQNMREIVRTIYGRRDLKIFSVLSRSLLKALFEFFFVPLNKKCVEGCGRMGFRTLIAVSCFMRKSMKI